MSFHSQGGWRVFPLRTITDADSPPLLAKVAHSQHGYDVTVSDLCYVWQEKLTMADVIQRAKDIRCAIEPDNAENFEYIMRELSEAFATQGAFEVVPSSDGQLIALKMKSKMQNLNAIELNWEVRLQRLPMTAIRDIIVLPLIRTADSRRQQGDRLVQHIREKDHVIERLCDRLETSGDSLTTVFPGQSKIRLSRNKTQREQLSQHVPGLGVYAPEAQPLQAAEKAISGSASMKMLLTNTLDELDHPEVSDIAEDWWNHVDHSDLSSRHNAAGQNAVKSDKEKSTLHGTTQPSDVSITTMDNSVRDDDDDGFQQQDISRFTADHKSSAAPDDDQSSTEEDDDDDDLGKASSQRQTPASPPSARLSAPQNDESIPAAKVKRKLGALGGQKKAEQESTLEERRETIDDGLAAPKDTLPDKSIRHGGKLGTMGGRARASTPADKQPSPDIVSPPPRSKSKLGAIGGKIKQEPIESNSEVHSVLVDRSSEPTPSERVLQDTDDPARPGRSAEKAESPALRETSQERADRKRDQLKHSLEDQNKAGAKKKKRKF